MGLSPHQSRPGLSSLVTRRGSIKSSSTSPVAQSPQLRSAAPVAWVGPRHDRLVVVENPDLPLAHLAHSKQKPTRLAVQAKTGERSRLMLDVAGYRQARLQELIAVAVVTAAVAVAAAKEVISQDRSGGDPVAPTAINPFERQVHDQVATAGLRSDSEGVEPNRRAVVHPV
jgi:spoIIIJ-associated protein